MKNQNEIMTAQGVANYTGFSLSWVRKAVSNGTLTFYKPNLKTIFFKRSDIEAYIFSNRIPARGELAAKIASDSYFTTNYRGQK